MFSCVFVLLTVLKGIDNNQLIIWNNTKMQENVSVCTGHKTITLFKRVQKADWIEFDVIRWKLRILYLLKGSFYYENLYNRN